MIKVYSNPNPSLVHNMRNVLQLEGIETEIRNENLLTTAGGIPVHHAWPELWIVNEASYPQAMAIVEKAIQEDEDPQRAWRCKSCGEENEGQFAVCWNCGEEG